MSRPKKCRKVCCMPVSKGFEPLKKGNNNCEIVMTVDEYETIRLIDKEGFSQEECGVYMGVARTTVQQIYNRARQKIADALVEGIMLKIEGLFKQEVGLKEQMLGSKVLLVVRML